MSKNLLKNFIYSFLLLLIVLGICFTISPIVRPVPHRDSGIFLQTASEMLSGKTLYSQVWDHKQPLIFWINELGLSITKSSYWGVWGIEFTALLVSAILGFFVLKRFLPPFISFTITSTALLGISPFMSGNFIEEYAIFFQIAILFTFINWYLNSQSKNGRRISLIVLGVLAGFLFLLKQNEIDFAAAVFIVLVIVNWKQKKWEFINELLFCLAGFMFLNLLVFGYFFLHGITKEYWFTAFQYNFAYSEVGLVERLNALLEEFEFMLNFPLIILASCVWLTGLFVWIWKIRIDFGRLLLKLTTKTWILLIGLGSLGLLAYSLFIRKSTEFGILKIVLLGIGILSIMLFVLLKNKRFSQKIRSIIGKEITPSGTAESLKDRLLLTIGLISFPLALASITLSGRNFPHYFTILFASIFALLAGGFSIVFSKHGHCVISITAAIAILLVVGFPPTLQILTAKSSDIQFDEKFQIAEFVKRNSHQNDTLLVWGSDPVINFMSGRLSASKYMIQYPLYLDTPYRDQFIADLNNEITSSPPKFIIDTMSIETPLIKGSSTVKCIEENPVGSTGLKSIVNFICTNYQYVKTIGTMMIYERK